MQGRSTGNIFSLFDGKENKPLKERRMAKGDEIKKQELSIRSKEQESGSLCDKFLLFRDYAECFFLSFWGTEERKRRCVVIDRRIRSWFCF